MRKSKLKKNIQNKLIELFVCGSTARCAAEVVGINKSTAIYYFYRLRKIIYEQIERENDEYFKGEIEVDESYFGGHRKGKRGRGASGKIPVFGILKRSGKVYTRVILNSKSSTLLPIIRDKVLPDSIVYSDQFRSYNVLDVSEFKHYRINHSKLFTNEKIILTELKIFGIKPRDI